MTAQPIMTRVTAQLMDVAAGRGQELPVDLRYEPADPFAVFLDIHEPKRVTTWMFARDLLNDGMRTAHGEGDVTVTPHPFDAWTLIVDLSVPKGMGVRPGHAVLHFDIHQVAEFLVDTYMVVPAGTESDLIDFGRELALWGAEQ